MTVVRFAAIAIGCLVIWWLGQNAAWVLTFVLAFIWGGFCTEKIRDDS